MCTVSWRHDDCGYALFFNRDERRQRGRALPPKAHRSPRGRVYLAPTDMDAGGTWLAVSQRGVTLGLLNHYAADRALNSRPPKTAALSPIDELAVDRAFTSRGSLIPILIDAANPSELRTQLSDALQLNAYRPFVLLAVFGGAERRAYRHVWDGTKLAPGTVAQPPLSSSSFETDRVVHSRCSRFPDIKAATSDEAVRRMEAFHRGHDPARGPYSVCMHRPDARTVSLSWIRVDEQSVAFRYGDGPACLAELDETLVLSLDARVQ